MTPTEPLPLSVDAPPVETTATPSPDADPMAEQLTAKAVGVDAAKSLVTVSVAVLGLSVTLMTSLDRAPRSIGYFEAAWIALVVATVMGWLTLGSVMWALNAGKKGRSGWYLNAGLVVLVFAASMLAVGAHHALGASDEGLDRSVEVARSAVTTTYPVATKVEVIRVQQTADTVSISLADATGRTYTVHMTRHPLDVTDIATP